MTSSLTLWALASTATAGTAESFAEPFHDLDVAATGDPGLITEINVREGQTVKKGDVIAVIDTRVLEKSLAIAKRKATAGGRADAMRAELRMRTDRLKKIEEMHARNHISNVEVERAKTDYAVAEANLRVTNEDADLAKLEVARIEAQIERQKVRSPIDGVVVTLHREVGESIVVTDTKLLRLVSLDMLRIKFPVTVKQSLQIKEGDYLNVTLPEINESSTAVVEVVSPVTDAKSGTVQVTCLIDNSEGIFRSGMRCTLQVEDEQTEEAPEQLVTPDEEAIEFEFPSVSTRS